MSSPNPQSEFPCTRGGDNYYYKECKGSFKSKAELLRHDDDFHVREKNHEPRFFCFDRTCPTGYRDVGRLRHHEVKMHVKNGTNNAQPISCDCSSPECLKTYPSPTAFYRHVQKDVLKGHGGELCKNPECVTISDKDWVMTRHLNQSAPCRRAIEQLGQMPSAPTDLGPQNRTHCFEHQKCTIKTGRLDHLLNHEKNHIFDPKWSSEILGPEAPLSFGSPKEEQEFYNNRVRLYKSHKVSSGYPFSCPKDDCTKIFTKKHYLQTHQIRKGHPDIDQVQGISKAPEQTLLPSHAANTSMLNELPFPIPYSNPYQITESANVHSTFSIPPPVVGDHNFGVLSPNVGLDHLSSNLNQNIAGLPPANVLPPQMQPYQPIDSRAIPMTTTGIDIGLPSTANQNVFNQFLGSADTLGYMDSGTPAVPPQLLASQHINPLARAHDVYGLSPGFAQPTRGTPTRMPSPGMFDGIEPSALVSQSMGVQNAFSPFEQAGVPGQAFSDFGNVAHGTGLVPSPWDGHSVGGTPLGYIQYPQIDPTQLQSQHQSGHSPNTLHPGTQDPRSRTQAGQQHPLFRPSTARVGRPRGGSGSQPRPRRIPNNVDLEEALQGHFNMREMGRRKARVFKSGRAPSSDYLRRREVSAKVAIALRG
ncbi:hypothetical protein T439DRAFT_323974 [Meredithblackwellia eburnea MCA 4105]